MTGELIQAALPTFTTGKCARDLSWYDRGRMAAVETPSALYMGYIKSIILHGHGDVHIYFERGESKSDVTVKPDVWIAFSGEVRDES